MIRIPQIVDDDWITAETASNVPWYATPNPIKLVAMGAIQKPYSEIGKTWLPWINDFGIVTDVFGNNWLMPLTGYDYRLLEKKESGRGSTWYGQARQKAESLAAIVSEAEGWGDSSGIIQNGNFEGLQPFLEPRKIPTGLSAEQNERWFLSLVSLGPEISKKLQDFHFRNSDGFRGSANFVIQCDSWSRVCFPYFIDGNQPANPTLERLSDFDFWGHVFEGLVTGLLIGAKVAGPFGAVLGAIVGAIIAGAVDMSVFSVVRAKKLQIVDRLIRTSAPAKVNQIVKNQNPDKLKQQIKSAKQFQKPKTTSENLIDFAKVHPMIALGTAGLVGYGLVKAFGK